MWLKNASAAAADPDGTQATAVVLMPVIAENFVAGSESNWVHLYQDAGGAYLLAYFWVDALATFRDPLQGNWHCASGAPAHCEVHGRFLLAVPAVLGAPGPDD